MRKQSVVKKNSATYKHQSSITKMSAKRKESNPKVSEVVSASLPIVPHSEVLVGRERLSEVAEGARNDLGVDSGFFEREIGTISEEKEGKDNGGN